MIANGVKLSSPSLRLRAHLPFCLDYAAPTAAVTAVHKANIMKLTDGMFLSTFREVAMGDCPAIEADDCIIDALCMKLVQKPEKFDVLVAPNLYGYHQRPVPVWWAAWALPLCQHWRQDPHL